jgi:predicted cupin superfamily sugar epimerase
VTEADAHIARLGLLPHPEGGFYRETFRSSLSVDHGAPRSASTAIYFLLPARTFSAFHRVRSDEVWHHYDGDALDLHTIDEQGTYAIARLGHDYDAGQRPQAVVPAGVWQAAVPLGRYALCGCTVAPGFDFADFELPDRAAILERFPALTEIITKLTR